MKRWSLAVLCAFLLAGCGEPPQPTGPAAEASTADIQITMDEPGALAGPAVAE